MIKVNILYIHFLELDEQEEKKKKKKPKNFSIKISSSATSTPSNSMAAEVAKLMRAKFSDYDDIFLWNFMEMYTYIGT